MGRFDSGRISRFEPHKLLTAPKIQKTVFESSIHPFFCSNGASSLSAYLYLREI